eukprot:Gb_40398 [translate_table: standard]
MTLHEWFQSLEEYFKYAGCQHEREKVVIVMIHLTGQAYTWATQICKYQGTDLPWNTLEEFKEGMELREKWQAIWEKCYVEEDCEDNDKEYQTEEGFPELESPPTSDNKDKIDETLEEKIVKLKGKEDDSNIPTFDQPEKPEEHEDGGGDHIIHDDDVDDGEMDHEENFCDEEDYDLDSYDKPKDTINEDVWDPFPIVPQTQYSGYDDLAREDDHSDGAPIESFRNGDDLLPLQWRLPHSLNPIRVPIEHQKRKGFNRLQGTGKSLDVCPGGCSNGLPATFCFLCPIAAMVFEFAVGGIESSPSLRGIPCR